MPPEEIEERMDELGRRLAETHDKKIIKELYDLALELEKVDKQSDSDSGVDLCVKVLDEAEAAKWQRFL
jgi:hypothetical protein